MKKKLITLGISILFFTGCATMGKVAEKAGKVKPEKVVSNKEAIQTLADDFIPDPYKMPIAFGGGWIAALLRRLWKDKKRKKKGKR